MNLTLLPQLDGSPESVAARLDVFTAVAYRVSRGVNNRDVLLGLRSDVEHLAELTSPGCPSCPPAPANANQADTLRASLIARLNHIESVA